MFSRYQSRTGRRPRPPDCKPKTSTTRHCAVPPQAGVNDSQFSKADQRPMRSSKSRSRNKSNRNRSVGNVVNRVFDSSGPEGKVRGNPYLEMDGQAVFKLAVRVLGECAQEALSHNSMSADELDWLIPHQANMRIINATADRMKLPMSQVVTTVARHGNTSAASVPLALDTAVRDGRVQTGQNVMLQGVGGGMTWGSILLRW